MKKFDVKKFAITTLIVAIAITSVLALLFGVQKTYSAYRNVCESVNGETIESVFHEKSKIVVKSGDETFYSEYNTDRDYFYKRTFPQNLYPG